MLVEFILILCIGDFFHPTYHIRNTYHQDVRIILKVTNHVVLSSSPNTPSSYCTVCISPASSNPLYFIATHFFILI